MQQNQRKKIGDLLKEAGLITEVQILEALDQKRKNQKLGDALVEQGYITEKQLLRVLEIQLNLESISLYAKQKKRLVTLLII